MGGRPEGSKIPARRGTGVFVQNVAMVCRPGDYTLVRVRTNLNADEVSRAQAALRAASINCVVMDGGVLVRPDQLDEAHAVLTGAASTPRPGPR
jgi:hypothetical protein